MCRCLFKLRLPALCARLFFPWLFSLLSLGAVCDCVLVFRSTLSLLFLIPCVMPQLRGVERLEGPKRLKLNFRVNPGQYSKIRENKTQLNLLSKTKMKPWAGKEGNQNKTINPNSLSQNKKNGSSPRPVMLTSKYSEILSTGIYKLDSATQTHSHILRRRVGGGTCTVNATSVPNSTKHNIQNKVYIPAALWVKSYSVPDNFGLTQLQTWL